MKVDARGEESEEVFTRRWIDFFQDPNHTEKEMEHKKKGKSGIEVKAFLQKHKDRSALCEHADDGKCCTM